VLCDVPPRASPLQLVDCLHSSLGRDRTACNRLHLRSGKRSLGRDGSCRAFGSAGRAGRPAVPPAARLSPHQRELSTASDLGGRRKTGICRAV